VILHIDMDAFFAAVEQLSDPRLRGKPVLVCGDIESRSVVAAASYEARPFGVRSGMPARAARRLCPQGVFVPGNPAKYVSLSLEILEVLKEITPLIEPMSIDEAFLDLQGTRWDGARAEEAARRAQRAIAERFRLTCSVGVGPNKLVAKMASGVRKPNGVTALSQERFRERFWGLPLTEMWGIGEKTAAALARLGLRTIGELARAETGLLSKTFGIVGTRLRRAACGEDESPVIPYFQGVPNKSMGHEHTLARDEGDPAALDRLLVRLADQTTRRLRKEGYRGRKVTLKLRSREFVTWTHQRTLSERTDEAPRVLAAGRGLLREAWSGIPLRLVGLSVGELLQKTAIDNLDLWRNRDWEREWIAALDAVRDRFGDSHLRPAATFP
jgi:DNA polymerase-4